jgi:hypothetical protein
MQILPRLPASQQNSAINYLMRNQTALQEMFAGDPRWPGIWNTITHSAELPGKTPTPGLIQSWNEEQGAQQALGSFARNQLAGFNAGQSEPTEGMPGLRWLQQLGDMATGNPKTYREMQQYARNRNEIVNADEAQNFFGGMAGNLAGYIAPAQPSMDFTGSTPYRAKSSNRWW